MAGHNVRYTLIDNILYCALGLFALSFIIGTIPLINTLVLYHMYYSGLGEKTNTFKSVVICLLALGYIIFFGILLWVYIFSR